MRTSICVWHGEYHRIITQPLQGHHAVNLHQIPNQCAACAEVMEVCRADAVTCVKPCGHGKIQSLQAIAADVPPHDNCQIYTMHTAARKLAFGDAADREAGAGWHAACLLAALG